MTTPKPSNKAPAKNQVEAAVVEQEPAKIIRTTGKKYSSRGLVLS